MSAFTNSSSVENFFANLVENPVWYEWLVVIGVPLLVILCLVAWRTVFALLSTVHLWITFWGGHLIVLVIQCILYLILKPFVSDIKRIDIIGRAHMICVFLVIHLNPFWRVKVHNRNGSIPRGSIVMCNHMSYVDSFALASAIFPTMPRFVGMGKLFKMPIMGPVMYLSGHLPVWFTKEKGGWAVKKGTVKIMMDRAAEYLDHGITMAVFPEGGLARTGEMLPFKDGFFQLAMKHNTPIVPTAMWGNQKMFPPGDQFALARVASVLVNIGSAVYPSDFDSVEDLKEHVRSQIIQLRDSLPNFDLYETRTDSSDQIVPAGNSVSKDGEDLKLPQAQESPKVSL